MLMRTDPFRELDRLSQQVLGNAAGTWSRPTAMAMDAWRARLVGMQLDGGMAAFQPLAGGCAPPAPVEP